MAGEARIPLHRSKSKDRNLEFIMDETRAGNYTCACANQFNTSEVSNMAEVRFLAGPIPTVAPQPCRRQFRITNFVGENITEIM